MAPAMATATATTVDRVIPTIATILVIAIRMVATILPIAIPMVAIVLPPMATILPTAITAGGGGNQRKETPPFPRAQGERADNRLRQQGGN